ncbi:hypothetical protein Hanom_Chr03g00210311 [Helianthus anomalus]
MCIKIKVYDHKLYDHCSYIISRCRNCVQLFIRIKAINHIPDGVTHFISCNLCNQISKTFRADIACS